MLEARTLTIIKLQGVSRCDWATSRLLLGSASATRLAPIAHDWHCWPELYGLRKRGCVRLFFQAWSEAQPKVVKSIVSSLYVQVVS